MRAASTADPRSRSAGKKGESKWGIELKPNVLIAARFSRFTTAVGSSFVSSGVTNAARRSVHRLQLAWELHLRYLKGLPGAYCIATSERDEDVRKYAPLEPRSENEYQSSIRAIAGKCSCGGNYTLNAPPRCPKCRSTRLREGENRDVRLV